MTSRGGIQELEGHHSAERKTSCAQTGGLDCKLTSNLGGVLGIHGEGSRGQGHPRPEGPGGGGVCAGKGENTVMVKAPTSIQDEDEQGRGYGTEWCYLGGMRLVCDVRVEPGKRGEGGRRHGARSQEEWEDTQQSNQEEPVRVGEGRGWQGRRFRGATAWALEEAD